MIVYVCVSVCVWGRLYPGSGTRSGPTTFNLYDLGNLLNPPDPQFFVPEPLSSIISFFSTSVRWGLNKLVGARGPRWCLLQSEGVVKCTLILSPSASYPGLWGSQSSIAAPSPRHLSSCHRKEFLPMPASASLRPFTHPLWVL